jgi:hypothetical protein
MRKRLIFLICFFLGNLVLSSWFIDTWNSPNPVSRALPVLTWGEEGTLKINTYHDRSGDKSKVGEDYYSDKAPLPTLMMIPVYWMMKKLNVGKPDSSAFYDRHQVHIWRVVNTRDGRNFQLDKLFIILLAGSLLFGSVPFALMVWLSMKYAWKSGSRKSIVLFVMMGWYGSFVFVYSGTFFSHVFTGFLLVLSYIFIRDKKQYLISGIFAGLAFLSEYPAGLAILLWPVIIYLNERKISKPLLFIMGTIPALIAIALYNYYITGNPLKMLNAYHAFEVFGNQLKNNYGFAWSNISAQSLWGLSFSAYMGIFVFVPLLFIWIYQLLRDKFKGLWKWSDMYKSYLFTFAGIYFLLFASFFTWWGGWSFGPRYLVPLASLLLFEGIRYLANKRINPMIYLLFTGFGLFCSWMAKATLMYMIPDGSNPQGPKPAIGSKPLTDWLIPEFSAGRFNGNSLLASVFSPGISAFLWLVAFVLITGSLVFLYRRWYLQTPLKQLNRNIPIEKKSSPGKTGSKRSAYRNPNKK